MLNVPHEWRNPLQILKSHQADNHVSHILTCTKNEQSFSFSHTDRLDSMRFSKDTSDLSVLWVHCNSSATTTNFISITMHVHLNPNTLTRISGSCGSCVNTLSYQGVLLANPIHTDWKCLKKLDDKSCKELGMPKAHFHRWRNPQWRALII